MKSLMVFLMGLIAFLQALCGLVVWGTLAYLAWRVLMFVWHNSDCGILTHLSH